ncbi:MAG: hypothetical protein U1E23_12780 [Reyranellaceae bacterium]
MTAASSPHDALVLLDTFEEEVGKLIREFARRRKALSPLDKGKLALRLCRALVLQGRVKEEVLYPAAEAVLDGDDLEIVAKARIAERELLRLARHLESMPAREPDFDATVLVLAEQASHHLRRQSEGLMPRLRHSGLDLKGSGERMAALAVQLATVPPDRKRIQRTRTVMAGPPRPATAARPRR